MIASPSAISDTHGDASGFGSFVNIHKGRKIWLIALLKIDPEEEDSDPFYIFMDISALDAAIGWLNEKFDWQIIILNEGDSM